MMVPFSSTNTKSSNGLALKSPIAVITMVTSAQPAAGTVSKWSTLNLNEPLRWEFPEI